jgi:NADH:ubiquinone oxidoreductase subunit B-like Fe-S oxidoreductase
MLQEEMQNTLQQTDELKARNKETEEKILWRELGKGIQYLRSKSLQSARWSATRCCAVLERNMQTWWWVACRGLKPNTYKE